jgi:TrmH family RNA methyltransferase
MPSSAEVIRSRSNPLFKRLKELKAHGARMPLALIEGVRLLEDARAAGAVIREVAASPRIQRSPSGRALLRDLSRQGLAPRWMDDALLSSISELDTSPGILALAERPAADESRLFEGTPLILVAVGIQNPGNLGGLLRTAEAAGATGAYLTAGTADPFAWKALRGSMGSAFRLPSVAVPSLDTAIARLRSRKVVTVAAVARSPLRYDEADLRAPVAVLFGGEGAGLPEAASEAADLRVGIPMSGSVESLNVGVAAGILLFEIARQRRLRR